MICSHLNHRGCFLGHLTHQVRFCQEQYSALLCIWYSFSTSENGPQKLDLFVYLSRYSGCQNKAMEQDDSSVKVLLRITNKLPREQTSP